MKIENSFFFLRIINIFYIREIYIYMYMYEMRMYMYVEDEI